VHSNVTLSYKGLSDFGCCRFEKYTHNALFILAVFFTVINASNYNNNNMSKNSISYSKVAR